MGVTKTLWEILDHQRQEPAILDSRDAGTSHHGSRDQFDGLYRVLSAEIGLIGVGEENTYGHPTRGALEILEASGTTPLQSDERGIVTVSSTASGKLTIWSER